MPGGTAQEHSAKVLAGIIPSRKDHLELALRQLTPDHFADRTHRNIFVVLDKYFDLTGSVVTLSALGDNLRKVDAGVALLMEETFSALEKQEVSDDDFKWSLKMVRELASERFTLQALNEGLAIISAGRASEEEGSAHADARMHVLGKFADVDRDMALQEAPEGDSRTEAAEIMANYKAQKHSKVTGATSGILFGIPSIDEKTGGVQPGELDLVIGFTSDGKTTMCCQLAWSCAVTQGRNAVILTSETIREQVRRKIIARHSCLPQFGLANGLDSKDIKAGSLSDADEDKLKEVVDDYTENPAYGHLYIAQIPRGATMQTVESKLYRIARQFRVDLVVIDYLALLQADRKRQTEREELSKIVKDAKVLAATFNEGAGVPVVSPWQVSRLAFDEATKGSGYTLKALSETAEAEKTADQIISLLRVGTETGSRNAKLRCQILKNRDGQKATAMDLDIDYATGLITSASAATTISDLLNVPSLTNSKL